MVERWAREKRCNGEERWRGESKGDVVAVCKGEERQV